MIKDIILFGSPLLFWQGIASTNWGRSFDLWHLRFPTVVYTFLIGLLVFLLGRRLAGNTETGLVAALAYLGFFATYRYGRPFLTNAPEVFWLFVPFFALLYWRPASFASRVMFPVAMGLALVHFGGGTSVELIALAKDIREGVRRRFDIELQPEPVFIGFQTANPLEKTF